jgi:hypothetical protein
MKKLTLLLIVAFTLSTTLAYAGPTKSKFYDFQEHLINGEIKKPTVLFINHRDSIKFNQLLKLKKSFIGSLLQTSKERVFR